MHKPKTFTFTLCADDYALSPAVSRGIRAALAAGRLSATGAMTNRPGWPEAAKGLGDIEFDADIGLHLNLTLGAPLTPMPRFAPAGALPKIGAVIRAARAGALPELEIRAEIAAQLNAFEAAMGRAPDFLDGHQHVQVLPGVRDWVLAELARRGLAGRIWLRDSGDQWRRILWRRAEAPKATVLAFLARGFLNSAKKSGFAVNDGFAGFSDFDPKRDYAPRFARYLQAPGERHLVMCHPGYVDDELVALDPATRSREQELTFLLSAQFMELLEARGARLARFQLNGPLLQTTRPHIPN